MNSRNKYPVFILLLPFLLVQLISSTQAATPKGEKKLVIPDYPTSKDQYTFAAMYEQSQIIPNDLKRRKAQLQKVAHCYERVVSNFPDDLTFTPRAILELGDCAAQATDYKQASSYYKMAMQRYPDDEYIQARAMCAVGLIQDMQKNHETAKATYKEIMDRFGNSGNGAVREIVKRASTLYFKVHETKVEKKGFSVKSLNPFRRNDP